MSLILTLHLSYMRDFTVCACVYANENLSLYFIKRSIKFPCVSCVYGFLRMMKKELENELRNKNYIIMYANIIC